MTQVPARSGREFITSRPAGRPALWSRIDLRLLIVAVAAALFGMAFSTGARHVVEAYRSVPAQNRPAVQPPLAVELPREWRWERKAIEFERMFRKEHSTPRPGEGSGGSRDRS